MGVGLAVVIFVAIAYNLVCPLNTEALKVWRNVYADDVEFVMSEGASGLAYTQDKQLIAELLSGLSWARYQTWIDGMSANKTGTLYFVLRDRKTRYEVNFNDENPSIDISQRFENALKELRAAPFSADEYRVLNDRMSKIKQSK